MSVIEFKQKIDQLLTRNAQYCDPVGFAYIQSLVNRIELPLYCDNAALIAKVTIAIEQYESGLSARREQVKPMLDELLLRHPDKSHEANGLFEQCQFNRLEKLCRQMSRAHQANPNLTSLSELNSSINQFNDAIETEGEELSFEQILSLQEKDVVTTASARQALKQAPVENEGLEQKNSVEQVVELQSMKVFRESIKHVNIDRIIDRAINDEPANPGPHNPHMLAIKSLTQMRELSPQYLRRFTAYIETLLWLEKNAAKLSDTKKSL